jgi:hypothetical protein
MIMEDIDKTYYCQWQCKVCGKINIESETKEILCHCSRTNATKVYEPFDLNTYIEEFHRGNFTHVNDVDRDYRASNVICGQVYEWLVELRRLRAAELTRLKRKYKKGGTNASNKGRASRNKRKA